MSNRTCVIVLKAILLPFRLLGHYFAVQGLLPLRRWLDQMEIRDAAIAHTICQLIPAQCPFERDIYLFGRKVGHIPPLCKLNPFYEEVTGLRFRALCYLADECGEDVGCYV
ncbi:MULTISPECIES: Mo-dependent nitrogenase C-terminal domain-containing protein [unclassified Leptolyngbya]|uniref:Mo-dependent nitrogenase C-terminal domain-containing protein n=1 Tax=unclassified Leptolyngbya TaxID=2650499 RepID=UPI001685F956|nr:MULTISPECIES: Mo-dependent nitrogenase C-terminal domain-containing protein [unclassified Leptolyngbya]MBD1911784.1 Mo-dependent nitrogenase C-terminal domain-containing protein [Leptolyngbya sp. FACHB-8]MBD2153326.1 Mo-dependent nitrogenase C-terminal domain-containing protein [Leptolyngbya sp. FACHB-16]